MADNLFESRIFADHLKQVDLAGDTETVLDVRERPLERVADAFGDIGKLAVVGFKSQGEAQALNIRDTFARAGIDTKVVVGLRNGSRTRKRAEELGFSTTEGTLTTVEDAVKGAGIVLMLMEDAGLVDDGASYLGMVQSGADVGFAHGFYDGYLKSNGWGFRDDVNVYMTAPKGLGDSVRKLHVQGSGINSSHALEQGDPAARDRNLAWATAISSPYIFQTSLTMERLSDLVGERSILLGEVHGMVQAEWSWRVERGMGGEQAYLEVVESLVGPLSRAISHEGLVGAFEQLSDSEREQFIAAYNAAYPILRQTTEAVYYSVANDTEITEVVDLNRRAVEMEEIGTGQMWQDGEKVRASLGDSRDIRLRIDPRVAGLYIAGMMAQVDVLRAKGHFWSEIVNESIIEAVDSLNPYMRKAGVRYMVDNCSKTARRGDRKWFPIFQSAISEHVLPVLEGLRPPIFKTDYFADFLNHDVHGVLAKLGKMRPPIDIAV